MIAETLAGIALVKQSVDFIKSQINTAKDIGELAGAVDGLFRGQDEIEKARNKKAGVSVGDQLGIKAVAQEVIDAKLATKRDCYHPEKTTSNSCVANITNIVGYIGGVSLSINFLLIHPAMALLIIPAGLPILTDSPLVVQFHFYGLQKWNKSRIQNVLDLSHLGLYVLNGQKGEKSQNIKTAKKRR